MTCFMPGLLCSTNNIPAHTHMHTTTHKYTSTYAANLYWIYGMGGLPHLNVSEAAMKERKNSLWIVLIA